MDNGNTIIGKNLIKQYIFKKINIRNCCLKFGFNAYTILNNSTLMGENNIVKNANKF